MASIGSCIRTSNDVINLSQLLLVDEQETVTSTEISTKSESSCTAKLILDCHCELGEGIVYDEQSNSVIWTDILSKQIHILTILDDESGKAVHSIYNLPKMLGSFGLLANIEYDINTSLPLLCAWEDGFQLFDVVKGIALSEMSIGESVNPLGLPSRLNDGRTDPTGQRYICGGYYGDTEGVKMKVYKCEQKSSITESSATLTSTISPSTSSLMLVHEPIVNEISTTNSICWSNDPTIMYLADSPTKEIHSFQYSSSDGTLSQKQFLHTKPKELIDVPDGSCVDADGYIWNSVWKSGKGQSYVQRIDPISGQVVYTVHIPFNTSQVTCCCFGGAKLNILFITSAGENVNSTTEPHAGGLFAINIPFVNGRPEQRLQFNV